MTVIVLDIRGRAEHQGKVAVRAEMLVLVAPRAVLMHKRAVHVHQRKFHTERKEFTDIPHVRFRPLASGMMRECRLPATAR